MGKVVGLTISSGKFSMLKKAWVACFGGSNERLSDRMGEQGGVEGEGEERRVELCNITCM